MGKPDYNYSLYGLMDNMWKQMRDEGHITKEEFESTNQIAWHREIEEVKEPFRNVSSVVRKAGLELKQINYVFGRNPLHKDYTENNSKGKLLLNMVFTLRPH